MIKIIVDSTTDFTLEEAQKFGIKIVPLKTTIHDIEYKDRIDLNPEKFYELLETTKTFPKTSQPSPLDFANSYQENIQNQDQILVITISSGLSGTAQSATLAKNMSDYEDIYVLDSKYATHGAKIIVLKALELIQKGKSFKEICEYLEEFKKRITILAIVDTLEYLEMGGRISKTTATIGTVLKLKPILTMTEEKGVIESIDKKRGTLKATQRMIEIIHETGDIDVNEPVFIGYTGEPSFLDKFESLVQEEFHLENIQRGIVGPVIGSHLGPGARIISYVKK
ncbi:MAG: DegV family protein [Traorella sp.]